MLLVQNDAINYISDGRKWGAEYFQELAGTYGEAETSACLHIAEAFRKVSSIANEMRVSMGDWNDTEKMLQNFSSRSVREKLGKLIDYAKQEDEKAYEQIKVLLNHI